jgi:hypothetical protein
MNTLTVSIEPGSADTLVRTDTFYPGWRAQLNGQPVLLEHNVSPFSTVDLPASEAVSILTYSYRPSHTVATISLAVLAVLFLLGEIGFERFRTRKA